MVNLNEHQKEVAEEFGKIAAEAKYNAKEETGNLARSLAIIFGAATAGAIGLNAVETAHPLFKIYLASSSIILGLGVLSYHSLRQSILNSVSELAKTKELGIKDGEIIAPEKLPRFNDISQIVAEDFNVTKALSQASFLFRAVALSSAMATTGIAYLTRSEIILVDRNRNEEHEIVIERAPLVMDEPPRQPIVPALP